MVRDALHRAGVAAEVGIVEPSLEDVFVTATQAAGRVGGAAA